MADNKELKKWNYRRNCRKWNPLKTKSIENWKK